MTSFISSLLFQSTGESRSDTFQTFLLQMRREMGEPVTCSPKGKKVSPEPSWRGTGLLEDQLDAQYWGQLSSPGYRPEDLITAISLFARTESVLSTET